MFLNVNVIELFRLFIKNTYSTPRTRKQPTVRRELVKHKQCGIREPDKHLSSFCAAVQIRT